MSNPFPNTPIETPEAKATRQAHEAEVIRTIIHRGGSRTSSHTDLLANLAADQWLDFADIKRGHRL